MHETLLAGAGSHVQGAAPYDAAQVQQAMPVVLFVVDASYSYPTDSGMVALGDLHTHYRGSMLLCDSMAP